MDAQFFDKVQVVSINSRVFSGQSTLEFDDFGALASSLPQEVMKPGEALLCDPKRITKLKTMVKRAQRLCLSVGVRYRDGYLIPIEVTKKDGSVVRLLDETVIELNKIKAEIEDERQKFVDAYPLLVESWAQKVEISHPLFAQKIRSAAPAADKVAERIWFEIEVEGISLPKPNPVVGDGGLSRRLSEIPDNILKEIHQEVKDWNGKENGTRCKEFREKIESLKQKALGLAFADPTGKVLRVTELMDQVIPQIPHEGRLTGVSFLLAAGLMDKLSKLDDLLDGRELVLEIPQASIEIEDAPEDSNLVPQTEDSDVITEADLSAEHEEEKVEELSDDSWMF